MKEPGEMLYRLLANGGQVEDQGIVYAMGEDGSLCWLDQDGVGRSIPCDLAAFKRMADRIGADEIWLKLCSATLKKTGFRK